MASDAGDEEEEHHSSAINWDSLLKAAESPELQDILRTPIEEALHILREGREIQKLSLIRNLTDLFAEEGNETVEKVLPLIQKVLEDESSNLDLHCEAAVTYKNIIQNEKFTKRFPGLTDAILSGLLSNVARQKENLSAAAWLETLVEILDFVPQSAIKQAILPVVLSQAEPSQRVQRRVIAAKLVEKLCAILSPSDVRKELAPCAQMLAQDANPNVRSSIAQRLGVIAQSLNNANDCATLLLPCLIELCKDDDLGVREAILNTIAVCLPHFSKDSQKTAVIPLLKRSTEQAIFLQDDTLTVVAKNFGQWIFILKDVMLPRDRKWYLDAYIRMANLSQSSSVISSTSYTPNHLLLAARRMCAYNFPCMVLVYGSECFTDRLLPLLESFCVDLDEDIRCAVAAGYHEIVNFYPNEPALIRPFIDLIRDSAAEVVGHLTGNLDRILTAFYKCLSKRKESDSAVITRPQLDRFIIGCNRLIRVAGSWRAHHSYLVSIAVIRKYIPVKDLFLSFVPMLKQEVLTARAIPCRVAAAMTLLLFMRESPNEKDRKAIIDFFIHSIAKHRSCNRRRLMLDVAPLMMLHFSRDFFHENLLSSILQMSTDQISNIRLQLCRLLPKVKENLILPQDEEILRKLEKTVREMLSKETNLHTRQLLQTYACELSRAETKVKRNKLDEDKRKDELELWNRVLNENDDSETLAESPNSALKNDDRKALLISKNQNGAGKPPIGTGSTRTEVSPWRTRPQPKPKTAVVRPQPQVVVTQRSPSPMPRGERKSLLPLANPARENGSTSNRFSIPRPSVTSRVKPIEKPPLRMQNLPVSSKALVSSGQSPQRTAAGSLPGLRRSSTTTTGFNTKGSSYQSPMGLMTSRSSSCLRAPSTGLIKVQSYSSIERRPMHMSMRIRAVE